MRQAFPAAQSPVGRGLRRGRETGAVPNTVLVLLPEAVVRLGGTG